MTADGIVLVCMPFGQVFSPSVGLSLLKAELAAQGMSSHIRYFSIRFAELIGQHFYYGLSAEGRPAVEHLAGEWIFSRALFGSRAPGAEYVEQILLRRSTGQEAKQPSSSVVRRILRAREEVDGFLQWCLREVEQARPALVGFGSVFQQHVASLALARLVKQARPETFVVFGGANCEDVMGAETVRQFPFVDAAVSGEADLVFPELARRVIEGRPISDLPGVRTRPGVDAEFAGRRFTAGPPVRDLDTLPYPDYGDYFEQFNASRFGPDWQPSIYLETSRGCWWGERMHCTFCGLNGQTMAFRSKSARRAVDELTCLSERHPGCNIAVTDNILDMSYFKDVVPELAARAPGPSIFYEVKANLDKRQLRMLRDAGIRNIQPGIESFSDAVLKLMRKGVSALQNIQLLKWCKELGVNPAWNLIWGFPGEPAEEYERMAKLVPLLTHLPAPKGFGMIRLDRFSPNFVDADRLGFADVLPLPSYRYVYPLPDDALANLAYSFSFGYREPRDVDSYVRPLHEKLRAWRRRAESDDLFSVDTGDDLLVWDLRSASRTLLTMLRGPDRLLYSACDSACDLRSLVDTAQKGGAGPLSAGLVEGRLAPLVERGLLVQDRSRYLALAVPLGEYSPPAPAVERFYELAGSFGRKTCRGWLVASERPARRRRVAKRLPERAVEQRRGDRRLTTSQFSVNDRGDVLIAG